MADTTEHHIALREAHQVVASDSFFAARKELRDTDHERYIFDAGFRRGFDAHESLQRKATATPPADAALADELLRLAGAFDTSLNNAASVSMNKRAADSLRETLIEAAAAMRARAVPDELVMAFGLLWHVRMGCDFPVPEGFSKNISPEEAAAKARKFLYGLLTHEQRGDGINRASAMLAASKAAEGCSNGT